MIYRKVQDSKLTEGALVVVAYIAPIGDPLS